MTSTFFHNPTLLAAAVAALLPFFTFALIMVFTRPYPRLSAVLSIGAVSVSLICAIFLLGSHWHLEEPIQYTGKWMISGDIHIPFGFLLDQLSLLMLTIVAVAWWRRRSRSDTAVVCSGMNRPHCSNGQ